MMKTKILFQLNQLGYGGTEKAIFTFLQNLDLTQFEPYLFFNIDYKSLNYYRRKLLSLFSKKYAKSFHAKYVISFARYDDFKHLLGEDHIFIGNGMSDFLNVLRKIHPDIIHFNRGNEEDFYTAKIDLIPKEIACVETNIFGKHSNPRYEDRLSKIFFVSQWLIDRYGWSINPKAKVLYNPICTPKTDLNLRDELNIPSNAIVLGRISRPDLDNGEFIEKILASVLKNSIYFITIGSSEQFKQNTKDNQNIKCLDPTTDEVYLSKFYNTIDILLHYRKEGETFGMNIAEAMIHGKPVVSHKSSIDNAQAELLFDLTDTPAGIVTKENDYAEYTDALNLLIQNNSFRLQMGKNAKLLSEKMFEEHLITNNLENFYLDL